MTDYIKRDKRQRTFIEIADDLNDLATELNDKIVESIREENADAVPVVRCKECKHCNTDWAMGKWYGSCKIWNTHSVMADWYCVNGERKDNECMERNDDARRSNEYE